MARRKISSHCRWCAGCCWSPSPPPSRLPPLHPPPPLLLPLHLPLPLLRPLPLPLPLLLPLPLPLRPPALPGTRNLRHAARMRLPAALQPSGLECASAPARLSHIECLDSAHDKQQWPAGRVRVRVFAHACAAAAATCTSTLTSAARVNPQSNFSAPDANDADRERVEPLGDLALIRERYAAAVASGQVQLIAELASRWAGPSTYNEVQLRAAAKARCFIAPQGGASVIALYQPGAPPTASPLPHRWPPWHDLCLCLLTFAVPLLHSTPQPLRPSTVLRVSSGHAIASAARLPRPPHARPGPQQPHPLRFRLLGHLCTLIGSCLGRNIRRLPSPV